MNATSRIRATVLGLAIAALPVLGATAAVTAAPEHDGTVDTAAVADDPSGQDDTPWG